MPNEGRAHPFTWAPGRDEGPDLPITFQEACSAGLGGLLSKFVRLALQGKEARPHYYKKAPTPSKKVWVINPSLAL